MTAQHKLFADLMEALSSSLDLQLALTRSLPLLQRLVDADAAALGVSKPGTLDDYDWLTSELPDQFLARYAALLPHDFVRRSVVARPNVVLCDDEMLTRSELELSPIYHHSRDCQANLEQVMAVMLHSDNDWTSGLSLYRNRRHPFTDEQKAVLQSVVPVLRNTVTNCRTMASVQGLQGGLEAVLESARLAVVVVDEQGHEHGRTEPATALLDLWFPVRSGRRAGVPQTLVDHLVAHTTRYRLPPPLTFRKPDEIPSLQVSFARNDHRSWAIILRREPTIPSHLAALLTRRELEVCQYVLLGKTGPEIADLLGCSPMTVKVHERNIRSKWVVENRHALMNRAREEFPTPGSPGVPPKA